MGRWTYEIGEKDWQGLRHYRIIDTWEPANSINGAAAKTVNQLRRELSAWCKDRNKNGTGFARPIDLRGKKDN